MSQPCTHYLLWTLTSRNLFISYYTLNKKVTNSLNWQIQSLSCINSHKNCPPPTSAHHQHCLGLGLSDRVSKQWVLSRLGTWQGTDESNSQSWTLHVLFIRQCNDVILLKNQYLKADIRAHVCWWTIRQPPADHNYQNKISLGLLVVRKTSVRMSASVNDP
jgi:hypothetical protein